jgi:hypothetical protein
MSFKDLKNKKSALTDLQKKLEETSSTFGTKDERIWTPEKDKAGNGYAVIRFLPACEGEDMPFVKLYSHGFKGPTGLWYIENSLTTLGQTDPIGDYNKELWNSGEEELKNQVRRQKRKLNYYSNIYIVKHTARPEDEGKVFLFRYGKKIFDKIMDAVNGDELENRAGYNPFDLWEGADFKLRVKQVEGYPNYDQSNFENPSTLEGLADAQLESIWKRQYPLQPLIAPDQFKSVEELQSQLDRVLGRKNTTSTPVERKVNVSSKPTFTEPEVTKITDPDSFDGEETDALDYFRALSEA